MKAKVLTRVSAMVLLGIAVSLVALMLIYALQNLKFLLMLATVSWNG